ncbi:MAG: hypothetical protein JKY52_05085, partial [Flavobacteriales bacterium]|nr:hypothetical protein [Flavobacteriales bacterium]
MKLTLTIIMTLPCLLTLGQTCDTINGHAINCVDSNGLRQGEWEQRKKIVLLSWYNGYGSENGCKYGEKAKYVTLAKGNYKNNKKTGTWKYCLDGDRDVIQIEKLITYYDNGTTEEQNLYYNYVTSINP